MNQKITTFCLLLVMIFFSCKKEELIIDGNPGSSYIAILSKVLLDNQSIYEYQYNDSNLIVQEKSKFDFTTHHYNSKGQLATTEFYGNDDVLSSNLLVYTAAMNSTNWVTPANGTKGGIITYDYNTNGKLIKTTYSRTTSGTSEYSEFSYNSNNRISRQTMYWDNTATGYIDYSYDVKGNLVKELLYNMPSAGAAELITTTSYSFDNQLNPFKSTSKMMTPGIKTNLNNIIKETYTIHLPADQGSDKVVITESTYEYNAKNYPISKNGNVSYVYK